MSCGIPLVGAGQRWDPRPVSEEPEESKEEQDATAGGGRTRAAGRDVPEPLAGKRQVGRQRVQVPSAPLTLAGRSAGAGPGAAVRPGPTQGRCAAEW